MDSRLKYEDALANLNKGGLTGNTLTMAQNSLKNSYASAPGATVPTPTTIAPPMSGAGTPPAVPKNTAYDSALSSYLDALKGSNNANQASDRAAIAARRGYLDTLDTPGGLKQGAQESAALFNRNASSNLADLAVAQQAATGASQVALERLKYEQGLLPKPGEAFNLSPGQARYDAQGNQIAALADNPSTTEQYGSGAVGEYQFAKSQGYTGTFSQYQNEDANRKAKAAGNNNPTTISRDQLAAGEAKLRASKGPDGYVNPNVYLDAFNSWPGTTAEFLSKFPPKNYVNPANTWLPDILKPSGSGRSA